MTPSDRHDLVGLRARLSSEACNAIRAAAIAVAADPALDDDPDGAVARYISGHLSGLQTPDQLAITEHAIATELYGRMDELSQTTQDWLQQYMSQHAEALAALSNLAEKIDDTSQAITQNLK